MAILMRTVRARHPDPRYIPTPFLKKLWTKWNVPSQGAGKYSRTDGNDNNDPNFRRSRMREAQDNFEDTLQDVVAQQGAARGPTSGVQMNSVNRNTSVRSVMTLPAYRPNATDQEQVLGREGERGGIDTVVELPRAESEDEMMREEEMEALYQIRLTRRRQIAEREERRQQRREARERNDTAALQAIRERTQEASRNNNSMVDDLREAHEAIKQARQRAVSSVSYGEVGLVRADGTRLRANSQESERMGLLGDSASIALSTADTLQHRRAASSTSILSIDTFRSTQNGGSRTASPALVTGSRTSSRSVLGDALPRTSSSSNRAGSSPEIIDAAEADLGDGGMPDQSPPGYDDVSLDDMTPVRSHQSHNSVQSIQSFQSFQSGPNSPYNEPPPDYPGPTQARQNRLSAHMTEDQHLSVSAPQHGHSRSSSRGVGDAPQLPSLRLNRLPQIVIEPSSAHPVDGDR